MSSRDMSSRDMGGRDVNSRELSRRALLSALLVSAAARTTGMLSLPALLMATEQVLAAEHEHAAALQADKVFTTLSEAEAAEFAAIAARILPSDDTPGATEAGVIYFIDAVLGSSRGELLDPMRAGLASLQDAAQGSYGTAHFSLLAAEQQDALLRTIETTGFFATLRYLTLAGMFTLPEYGGNRDYMGWDLLGFDHRHVWQPPFGYYDADYAARGE